MKWARLNRELRSTTKRAARLSPEKRRKQLLDCAIKIFARQGFATANHAAIAEKAEVSVPAVFNYFKTREALVNAVLGEVEAFYQTTMARAAATAKPADQALRDITTALTDTLETHPDYARILREWSVLVHDETWPRYLRHYNCMIAGMAAVIARGQAEGAIRSDLNAHDEAIIMYAGSWALIQMMEIGEPREQLDRLLNAVLQAVVKGPGQ
ncbi:TetR/AcrR family transcriptional regulator [Sphingobium sp. LB126]|uniref:TetR/AcrR family transcriptional regulator n=1 Tax=Sphingobium sp. LB126 TaxID=1983755 RepID=UPI002413BE94|nr:TetR/AcrR family transcriptional regulator [Sphingobium sp. LB126]